MAKSIKKTGVTKAPVSLVTNIEPSLHMVGEEAFIPFNVPSLKNSKIMSAGKGLFVSKTVMKYFKSLRIQSYSASGKSVKEYVRTSNLFRKSLSHISIPQTELLLIGFYFVRATTANFDFNNANQIILDLLTAHRVIDDDCAKLVLPVPYFKRVFTLDKKGQPVPNENCYEVDKTGAGVYLRFFTKETYAEHLIQFIKYKGKDGKERLVEGNRD